MVIKKQKILLVGEPLLNERVYDVSAARTALNRINKVCVYFHPNSKSLQEAGMENKEPENRKCGEASNFKVEGNYIVCDILIYPLFEKTIPFGKVYSNIRSFGTVNNRNVISLLKLVAIDIYHKTMIPDSATLVNMPGLLEME